jgi:succinate dehydrogenase / fumarate reductase membrane anchor subunit
MGADARRALFRGHPVSSRPGSASRHWLNQRLTSIALLPLGLWFLLALLRQPNLDHAIVAGWLAKPLQALLAALFGAALLWHSMQGWQVVLEDYVGGSLRAISIGIARLAHVAAALALAFALVRLAMGAGA